MDEDSVMKRRFVVVTEKSRFGVIADYADIALFGLYFKDDIPTGASRTLWPTVIAFAPGAWLYFRELAEGRDWPAGLDVVHFGGEDEKT